MTPVPPTQPVGMTDFVAVCGKANGEPLPTDVNNNVAKPGMP